MSLNLVGLATRITAARKNRTWTLDQLYEKTGLGKGLLSKVENFRVTPSLPTIAKISSALNMPIEQLFEGLDEEVSLCIVKQDERKEVQRNVEDSTISYYDLAHERGDRRMEPFELLVPPGGGRSTQLSHEGEEFLTVIEGEITFTIDDKVHHLMAGDSVYFNAETKHCVQNIGKSEARVVCVFCR